MGVSLPVRLKDVAKIAGVSVAAVSHAMNGTGKISSATRKRILTIASELGFRRDSTAYQLIRRRWDPVQAQSHRGNIAILLSSEKKAFPQKRRNCQRLIRERVETEAHGYDFINLPQYPNRNSWLRVLHNRGVSGLIIDSNIRPDQLEPLEDLRSFALVSIDTIFQGIGAHSVRSDTFGRLHSAATIVHAKGHRRVGFALFENDPFEEDYFLKFGAVRSLPEKLPDLESVPPFFYPLSSPFDFEAFASRFGAWWQAHRPMVVIGSNDLVYHALQRVVHPQHPSVGFFCLNLPTQRFANKGSELAGFAKAYDIKFHRALSLLALILSNPAESASNTFHLIIESVFREGASLRTLEDQDASLNGG